VELTGKNMDTYSKQLFYRGQADLRSALGVFEQECQRFAQHSAGAVDLLHGECHTVLEIVARPP